MNLNMAAMAKNQLVGFLFPKLKQKQLGLFEALFFIRAFFI